MKKTLLSLVTICCFCAAPAQESPIPFQTHEAIITNVSSNGSYAVGSTQGIGYFINAKTGKLSVFEETGVIYDIRAVADCGIAAGSYAPNNSAQMPCYVTEGDGFVPLPTPEGISGTCYGVPEDGSFIAGNVSISGIDNNGERFSYYQPVIWYRNESGDYDMYEELPFDKIGFDNRLTQGAWLLGVSGDGLTIYGRLIDASGTIYFPVMWKRASAQTRDWTYKELCSDFCFNKDEIAPEWPQYVPKEPDVTEYYTAEELEAFNEALAAYNDSVEHAGFTIPEEERWPWPTYNPNQHKTDFFNTDTPDGADRKNRYAEDYNKFLSDGQAYNDSIMLYYDRLGKYLIGENVFHILEMNLSNNGKYMVTTTETKPVIINPETEEVTVLEGVDGLFPTAVLDDGTVFLGQPAYMPPLDRVPYVHKNGAVMDFGDWVREHSEKAYNELMENFPDGHFGVIYSNNPEGLTFGGFNQKNEYGNLGWIMNLSAYDDLTTGITENKIADDVEVSFNSGEGTIDITGTDKADVRIYSVNGVCVYNAAGVSGHVSVASLARGTYVVEVKSGNSLQRKKVMIM